MVVHVFAHRVGRYDWPSGREIRLDRVLKPAEECGAVEDVRDGLFFDLKGSVANRARVWSSMPLCVLKLGDKLCPGMERVKPKLLRPRTGAAFWGKVAVTCSEVWEGRWKS